MGLYYPNTSPNKLIGYADARYLSAPDDSKSQMGYVFLQGGTAIMEKHKADTHYHLIQPCQSNRTLWGLQGMHLALPIAQPYPRLHWMTYIDHPDDNLQKQLPMCKPNH